jgi:single-strand DNA-binding protein
MNKVILIGRLTRDPEVRYTQGAEPMAIARYSLAVDRRFKRDGQPDADFINCVAFRRNGEFAEKFLKKGMKIAVEGSIQTGSYTDKDGNKRYTTDIVVEQHEFTESRRAFEERVGSEGGSAPAPNVSAPAAGGGQSDGFVAIDNFDDDDLPF